MSPLFLEIKNEALGQEYDLELVFLSPEEIQKINKQYRDKDKATNILSFPLSENSGQIFICKEIAKKEGFDLTELFIHGVIHLKGMDHGSRMESEEQKIRMKFGI